MNTSSLGQSNSTPEYLFSIACRLAPTSHTSNPPQLRCAGAAARMRETKSSPWRPAVERAYPRLPFTWPAVGDPAGGVFLIERSQLPADLE